jgi:uncharacterized protein YndB with AHSA1/START domain
VDFKKVWKTVVSNEGQAIWLKPLFPVSIRTGAPFETEDGFFGEIRTIQKERRVRLTWQDPNWAKKTVLQVTIVPRPERRSILVFDHGEINDLRVQAQMRQKWRSAAENLSTLMKALWPSGKENNKAAP